MSSVLPIRVCYRHRGHVKALTAARKAMVSIRGPPGSTARSHVDVEQHIESEMGPLRHGAYRATGRPVYSSMRKWPIWAFLCFNLESMYIFGSNRELHFQFLKRRESNQRNLYVFYFGLVKKFPNIKISINTDTERKITVSINFAKNTSKISKRNINREKDLCKIYI